LLIWSFRLMGRAEGEALRKAGARSQRKKRHIHADRQGPREEAKNGWD
jgi:hypothetical protein